MTCRHEIYVVYQGPFPRTRQFVTRDFDGSKGELLGLLTKAALFADAHGATLRVTNVIRAGGTGSGICFGDLAAIDLLYKKYVAPEISCENPQDYLAIRWKVIGNIVFSDEHGRVYLRGDVDEWEK